MGKLGDTLRERRIALGYTIEHVQESTRIRARLIEHIEEGNYDRLPDPGYVRGYISSYARFLELDPVPLLNMYKAETGAGRQHQLNLLPQTSEAVKPTGQQHAVPWRAAVIAALVIALLTLAIWGVTRLWRGPEPEPVEPSTISAPTTQVTPASEEATEPADEPAEKIEQTKQPFTLAVTIASGGASWLRIEVDGKLAYEGVLTGGQSEEYEVAQKASIRIGKPEAVTVLRDGQEVEIDETGDVGTVTLKATSAAD